MDITNKLNNKQRRIGLTGGIASGKSTITNYIRRVSNIPILDADDLSRQLIKPNTKVHNKILEYFGNQIIDKYSSEKAIDRTLLKANIFENEKDREWIQKLLHPLIKEQMIEKCNRLKDNKIILLVIPLLFEAQFEDICTEIWLVKCPKEVQIKRLMKRDNVSEKKADRIINLQLNFEEKLRFSNIILDNSSNEKRWINKIKELI